MNRVSQSGVATLRLKFVDSSGRVGQDKIFELLCRPREMHVPRNKLWRNRLAVAGGKPGEKAMSDSVYYHQGCPVCGRMLRIGVRLLGQRVYCQHCGGGFRATDADLEATADASASGPEADRVEQLLARADETLALSADTNEPGFFDDRLDACRAVPDAAAYRRANEVIG